MASSYTMRNFALGDGLTYATQDIRLAIAALISSLGGPTGNPLGIGSGVHPATGNPLGVATSSGLSVTVGTGYATIQSASANGGAYIATLDSAQTLTCNTASTTYARIDSLCITVNDVGTSSSTVVVQIVTGTPAASPVAPTLPADSLLLCNITVPANATTLTSGNLSDQRTYMSAVGGITAVQSSAFYPTVGFVGQVIYDMNLNRFKRWNGSAWLALSTVGFAPVSGAAGTVTASGTPETVSSASVTVDGLTTVKLTVKWSFISTAGTVASNGCVLSVYRGATFVDSIVKFTTAPDSNIDGGGVTLFDPNPAAGAYTYTFQVVNQGSGTFDVHAGIITAEAQPS